MLIKSQQHFNFLCNISFIQNNQYYIYQKVRTKFYLKMLTVYLVMRLKSKFCDDDNDAKGIIIAQFISK